MKAIINGKIIKENGIIEDKVLLFDEKIIDLISKDSMNDILDKNNDLEIIDAEGNYVSPGFIDLHIHGSGGSDVMDGTIKDVEIISRTIAETGVTSFNSTVYKITLINDIIAIMYNYRKSFIIIILHNKTFLKKG